MGSSTASSIVSKCLWSTTRCRSLARVSASPCLSELSRDPLKCWVLLKLTVLWTCRSTWALISRRIRRDLVRWLQTRSLRNFRVLWRPGKKCGSKQRHRKCWLKKSSRRRKMKSQRQNRSKQMCGHSSWRRKLSGMKITLTFHLRARARSKVMALMGATKQTTINRSKNCYLVKSMRSKSLTPMKRQKTNSLLRLPLKRRKSKKCKSRFTDSNVISSISKMNRFQGWKYYQTKILQRWSGTYWWKVPTDRYTKVVNTICH